MSNFLKNNKGFTLVELIAVLAIFLIILTCGFILLETTLSQYKIAEGQSVVQENVRNVMNLITSEIRYASDINFYDSLPTTIPDDLNPEYYYFILQNNTITHYKRDRVKSYTSDSYISSILASGELKEVYVEKLRKCLYVQTTIQSISGQQSFDLSSQLIILNLPPIDSAGNPTSPIPTFPANVVAISYKKFGE